MTRVALVQLRSEKGDLVGNVARIRACVDDALVEGAQIIVFPEMSVTGYNDPSRRPEAVVTLDHPVVTAVAALTAAYGLTLIAGIIERNPGGKPFITQFVAQRGEVAGAYRKITVKDEELDWFAPGVGNRTFQHGDLTFGVAICADIDDARIFSDLARQGAMVVFECAAPGPYGAMATRDWQAGFDWWRGECHAKLGRYAREHGITIAVSTQAGRTVDEDFPGGGYLFGPDGSCLAATPDWSEGILYVDLP